MVLIKDATEKAINTAILALNDDIEKVKASNSSSSSSGIKEGETYNINISGNANTASKVKNALTITNNSVSTVYDGSSAKSIVISSSSFSDAGDATHPIYFASNKPTVCFDTIANSITGNASTATKLAGGPVSGSGFIYKEYNYSNIPSLNMNYYTDSGIYTFLQDMNTDTSKSLVNAPIAQTNGGWCLMSIREGGNYNVQIFHPYDYASIYVRCSYYAGSSGIVWTGWSQK